MVLERFKEFYTEDGLVAEIFGRKKFATTLQALLSRSSIILSSGFDRSIHDRYDHRLILYDSDRKTIEHAVVRWHDFVEGHEKAMERWEQSRRHSRYPSDQTEFREGSLKFSANTAGMYIERDGSLVHFLGDDIHFITEAVAIYPTRKHLYSPVDDFKELENLL
jgi:hypothetical protein